MIVDKIQSLVLLFNGRFGRAREEKGGERYFVKSAFLPIYCLLHKLLDLLEEITSKNHNSNLVIYAELCKSKNVLQILFNYTCFEEKETT